VVIENVRSFSTVQASGNYANPLFFGDGTVRNAGHRPGSKRFRLQLAGTVPGAPFEWQTLPPPVFKSKTENGPAAKEK
jgi:hypothetical protein